MRIESIWVKGFRSLRDLPPLKLGAFNIFYGRNGAGKSNILEALKRLFDLLRLFPLHYPLDLSDTIVGREYWAKAIVANKILKASDLTLRDPSRIMVFGARFVPSSNGPLGGALALPDLSIEITIDWTLGDYPAVRMSMLVSDGKDPRAWPNNMEGSHKRQLMRLLLTRELPHDGYHLIGANRSPRREQSDTPDEGMHKHRGDVAWQLRNGYLKAALLSAHISPEPQTRRRLNDLRKLLGGPPLNRPPFEPVQHPETGVIELQEQLPAPNPEGLEIPIDLAGLGIAQVYSIVAQALLSGARVIGIEEPEAHLHAPTSGRALRELLKRLVDEGFVDQLMIATHSNLFDLDPTGYFDVSLVDGHTVVERSELSRIDYKHLYEPGPAKHALQQLLHYAPADEIVFRRGDGSPVTAAEMLKLLQEDDDIAVRFLEDIHGAAVRMVKVSTKKASVG